MKVLSDCKFEDTLSRKCRVRDSWKCNLDESFIYFLLQVLNGAFILYSICAIKRQNIQPVFDVFPIFF